MSTGLRESLTKFCQVELDLDDALTTYKNACAPITTARTNAYCVLTRVMEGENTPWIRLPEGGYLRQHTVKSQASLKEACVHTAVTQAIRALRTTPGSNLNEARARLLDFLRKELREARTTTNVNVKFVDTLPRSMEDDNVPVASAQLAQNASAWMHAQVELVRIRRDHGQVMAELQDAREAALGAPGVREYLTGISGGGQPVSLTGQTGKFKLRHSVSTRRKPMREGHVQDALKNAVEATLVDDSSVVSTKELTQLIMSEAIRLAGTETKDVFSLTSQRGRKRAAENE